MNETITHEKVCMAYHRYSGVAGVSLWVFVPTAKWDHVVNMWKASPSDADKIDMLCSPYWETLLKAFKIRAEHDAG